MNLTTSSTILKAIPNHWEGIGKNKKTIVLPDGTELSQEEFDKMDERRSWGKSPKKTVLGQNKK